MEVSNMATMWSDEGHISLSTPRYDKEGNQTHTMLDEVLGGVDPASMLEALEDRLEEEADDEDDDLWELLMDDAEEEVREAPAVKEDWDKDF
jgi:hypothetical protein